MKVGYQGIKGAYSELAIHKHFGKDAEAIGYSLFEDVFEAVNNREVGYGVLPFENTIAGSVARNYDMLLKEDVFIIAEIFLNIRHNLLSKKGNKLENIKIAYSHPHALEQCRTFLKGRNIECMPKYDTAGSAKWVAENGNEEEAAIASELCADIYCLEILESGIESNQNNTTKFLVFVKKENIPKNLKKEKTSIVFNTKHYPGALVNCLQRLAKNDINLTKLESRPMPENPWEYVFYADFEGGLDDENVKIALGEVEAAATFVKVLGSYPKGQS